MSTKCSKIVMTERKSAQKTSSFVWLDMHLWKENKLLVSFRNRAHFCIEREKNQLIKCLSRKVNEKRSYSSHFTSSILAPFVLCEWSVAVEANDVLSVPWVWVCVRLSIGEWIYIYTVYTVYTYVCVCLYEFIAQRLFWFCRWTFAELWSKTCFWLNISLIIHNNMCYCYCFVFIFLASLLHFFALALGHWFGVRWCYFSSLMRYRCLADRICVRVAITLFYVAIHFYLSAQFHQISMCFCIFILL